MKLLTELKRRKVPQTAAGYVVLSWLLVQVADTILPAFEAEQYMQGTIIFLSLIHI